MSLPLVAGWNGPAAPVVQSAEAGYDQRGRSDSTSDRGCNAIGVTGRE